MRVSSTWEISTVSSIMDVPSNLELRGKIDYLETKIIYEKFWLECQECFVFEMNTKYPISIDQMEQASRN